MKTFILVLIVGCVCAPYAVADITGTYNSITGGSHETLTINADGSAEMEGVCGGTSVAKGGWKVTPQNQGKAVHFIGDSWGGPLRRIATTTPVIMYARMGKKPNTLIVEFVDHLTKRSEKIEFEKGEIEESPIHCL
jgi:hypothetical protein